MAEGQQRRRDDDGVRVRMGVAASGMRGSAERADALAQAGWLPSVAPSAAVCARSIFQKIFELRTCGAEGIFVGADSAAASAARAMCADVR